jgi:ketosteroid isomerase-like protein
VNNTYEVAAINELLEEQTKAIRTKNITDAVKNYAADVTVFDVVGPLQHPEGSTSVSHRLAQWFSTFDPKKDLNFEQVELATTAGDNLAFSHSLNHVQATLANGGSLDMYWRETLNWQKTGGTWKITHTHSSVPFDPATGKASTQLKP